MKTTIKKTALGIVLMFSVIGVFASDIVSSLKGKKFIPYYWQRFNRNGTLDGPPILGDENTMTDRCPGAGTLLCAIGTSDEGPTITYFYGPDR